MKSANAVSMLAYGPPGVLTYGPVTLQPVLPGEVRIRTIAAAVNHTDLKIRAGIWPISKPDPFPYVPGVEVVGRVEEVGAQVPGLSRGQLVITMMQGLGGVRAQRQGTYAECVTVAAESLAMVPDSVDPYAMASLGLVGVTALEGLRRLGPLAGRRVIVTGAAGGVGSAATSIAAAEGACVIAIVTRDDQARYVRDLGAQEVIVIERDVRPSLPRAMADGVLDCVGGPLFAPCVDALRDNGSLSLVGAVGGGQVEFDAWQLIRPVTITGYSTETLTGPVLRAAVEALANLLQANALRVPQYRVMPLRQAHAAHQLLEGGGMAGRVLLAPEVA